MDNTHFAERLIQERNRNNLTQRELADKVGVSQGLISQYEKGMNLPSLEIFVKLTNALECTADSLLRDYTGSQENIEDYMELISTAIRTPRKNIKDAKVLLNKLIED